MPLENLQGTLNKNENRTEDWHSEYNGTAIIDDQEYYINAFIRTNSKTNKKFFSLKFKPKQPKSKTRKKQSMQSRGSKACGLK